MKTTGLPGTLWINRGRWNWKVKLPGTMERKNYPLRLPGQDTALVGTKGRSLAESIAWRIWEKASKSEHAAPAGQKVDEICGKFLAHADTYYRRENGAPTREAVNCEIALRLLRARLGTMQIDDITYQDILAARETLIESGLNRNTINQRVGIWRRFFSWALDNRLCSPQTKSEVLAVDNLKRGRTLAPDGDPVRPVPHVMVKRTIQFMPPNLRAMVQIQELCGARPDEMCSMRPCDIEQRRAVWVYRPEGHKTKHNGKCRVICLGPRAQRQLAGLLEATGPKRFIFNPAVATQERSNVWSQAGDRWTASNYGQAVRNAIKAAHKASVEVDDWSPNQLRHSCGTRVRRKFGPDAASAVLGHSTRGGARITDTYTIDAIERETITIASRPMQAIG